MIAFGICPYSERLWGDCLAHRDTQEIQCVHNGASHKAVASHIGSSDHVFSCNYVNIVANVSVIGIQSSAKAPGLHGVERPTSQLPWSVLIFMAVLVVTNVVFLVRMAIGCCFGAAKKQGKYLYRPADIEMDN